MIHSDSAAMYVNLRANPPTSNLTQIAVNPPYQHQWVNHTRNFVTLLIVIPQINLLNILIFNLGSCTNNVENFWENAKQKNKAMSGTNAELLPSYLDEFQWR